jgi:hypothetical protein
MNKVPVADTIAQSYRFTLSHLGTVIGLVWFPLVLATLLRFLPELAGNYGDAATDPVSQGTGAIASLAILILTTLLYSIMYVAVTRQALGLRQGPAMFHFSLSQPEFRVFGAMLLLFFVTLAFTLAYSLSAVGLITMAATQAAPIASLAFVFVLAGALALIYVAVRLGFLVVPVTVVESRINLGRGWTLTLGNFWRIVAVVVAIMAPIVLVEAVAMEFILGADVLAAFPKSGAADQQSIQQFATALEAIFHHHFPALIGLDLIVAPFNLGLSLSASAYVYRALAANAAPKEVTA